METEKKIKCLPVSVLTMFKLVVVVVGVNLSAGRVSSIEFGSVSTAAVTSTPQAHALLHNFAIAKSCVRLSEKFEKTRLARV